MPRINQIAELKTIFKFRAWVGSADVLHFDEEGVCRYENRQGVLLKKDMLIKDFEILCDHPIEWLAPCGERFSFKCTKCEQDVKIVSVKTVRPPHNNLPDKIELKPQGQIPEPR